MPGDRFLFFDPAFLPILEGVSDRLPDGLRYLAMTEKEQLPQQCRLAQSRLLRGTADATSPSSIDWPEFDENTAAGLCYTSGTTGSPKGSLYSHRSNVLHALFVLATEIGCFSHRPARSFPSFRCFTPMPGVCRIRRRFPVPPWSFPEPHWMAPACLI